MKSFKLLLALLIIFPIRLPAVAQTARDETKSFAGLKAPITVRRDARDVPHIAAASDEDLYFAQGYVTASDRLWQMDLLRRSARGELAEIFGKLALEEDKRRRTYDFAGLAERIERNELPAVRAANEAYARGVNAYIAALDEKTLPVEFRLLQYRPRPWRTTDTVAISKLFSETLSTTWQGDLARAALAKLSPALIRKLFPVVSAHDVLVVGRDPRPPRKARPMTVLPNSRGNEAVTTPSAKAISIDDARETLRDMASLEKSLDESFRRVGLHAEGLAASNNWVVAARRSATGRPLLANDPHLAPSAPSIWYLTHLSAPGVNVAGVTTPGLPGIIIGHNEHVAWGMTNLGPDVQDLYLETFDPKNARRYRTPAGWRDATVRAETIKVRKSLGSAATDDVAHEVVTTRHGPVVYEKDKQRYALRWTALEADESEINATYLLNRARGWNEFRHALKGYPGPTQNFVYADAAGNIGYYGAGRIPVRRTGDGGVPYDGATDRGEWTRYIPFEELPHVFNPPSGLIVTANSRVVGRSYPYFLTDRWSAPYRARRIYDLLQARQRHSVEDFEKIQGDIYSINGAVFARGVVAASIGAAAQNRSRAEEQANDTDWGETLKLLANWDGRVSGDSRAALMASEMYEVFRRRVMTASIGSEAADVNFRGRDSGFIEEVIRDRSPKWLPREFPDYAALLRACHGDARAAIAKRLGDDEKSWTWGRDVQARFPHPLARAPLVGGRFAVAPFPQEGTGGTFPTVNVGAYVSMRLIADPGDWDDTRHGIALGQSGDPSSSHWADQLPAWRAARPEALPFSESAVRAAARRTLTLNPAP